MATFEEQVNEVVKEATVDEKGNIQLPEGKEVSPEVLHAAKLEKRYRDTQSSYTKAQQQNKLLQAENERLAANWEAEHTENLTLAEKSKLEELKVQDTDAYIAEVAKIKDKAKTDFAEKRSKVTKEVTATTELERREQLLKEHNENNPDFQITDDVLENDIPPRIVKKLESGDISFAEFLEQATKHLSTPKVIKKDAEIESDPNLSSVGGGDAPTDKALNKKSSSDYSQEIF